MFLRGAIELKNVPTSGKSPQFSRPPPLPQDVLDFFEFGKNLKFDNNNPPSDLIWENFEIRKILDFDNHPRNKSLKYLKFS